MQVQCVRVVIQRGRPALREFAGRPKRVEIAEMVGLISGGQQFQADERTGGEDGGEAVAAR